MTEEDPPVYSLTNTCLAVIKHDEEIRDDEIFDLAKKILLQQISHRTVPVNYEGLAMMSYLRLM